ncbi:hypothetical protein MN0502_00710 [Arthrobacter sp. MN05-02]|nr:hypothetical protein MN0502_00710 [Arthrobacter sp. MN05-02]
MPSCGSRTTGPPTSAASRYPGTFTDAALRAEGRFRIGVSTASPFSGAMDIGLDSAATDAFAAGIRRLQQAGHDVVDADLTYDRRYHDAFQLVWTAGLATAPIPDGREDRLTDITRVLRRRALGRSAADLAAAVDVLRQFEQDTIGQYSGFDMILTPRRRHDTAAPRLVHRCRRRHRLPPAVPVLALHVDGERLRPARRDRPHTAPA